MCWIFGYKWNATASRVLLKWLSRLEYRGYDSWWIAITDWEKFQKIKAVWPISNLQEKVLDRDLEWFNMWIAHTRWATHGKVNIENTHPHVWQEGKVYVVHNWIIENYQQLKKKLENDWYEFYSDTDTEILAWLLEQNKWKDLLKTVENVVWMLDGAYAFLVMHADFPWQIVGVKYWSPLVFGYNDDWELFFSSDTSALGWYTNNVIFMDDGDCIFIQNNDFLIKSEWKLVVKPVEKIDTDNLVADKWDFQHFMLKEIYEQPEVLKNIFRWRVNFENKNLNAKAFQEMDNYNFKNIVFVWCWTSYHAWLVGEYWFDQLTNIKISSKVASEYEYHNIQPDDETLYVFISQSGETADVINTLKQIKQKWGKTMGLVNVVWSSISRETDFGMFLRAGTEVWVASTKAFTTQIWTLLLLALYFGQKTVLKNQEFEDILDNLQDIPDLMGSILKDTNNIQKTAKKLAKYKNFFFIGRNIQFPIAMESSLKFKEISYLHSEATSSWELKHWPLALIDEEFPTILINPKDYFFKKNLSSLQEIKARNWKVVWIWTEKFDCDWFLPIPKTKYCLYPFLTNVVGQLLSYYTALELDREIDKPRNLAKSVTVS